MGAFDRRFGRLAACLAWLAVAAVAGAQPAATPPTTAPASAGPGLPVPAFSSMGPGMVFSHLPSPDPSDPDDIAADKSTVARLGRQIPSARLQDFSLSDAFDYIRDLTDLTINVNWDALQGAAVSKETRIDISLKNVNVGGIVEAILAEAQNGRQVVDYEIQHGALTIDTVANLDKVVVTRSYEVKPLLLAMLPPQPSPAPRPVGEGGAIGPTTATTEPDLTGPRAALVRLVRENVMPGTWNGEDGKAPSVATEKTSLIVIASQRTQRAVAAYLDSLRPSNPSP
jgi:hypothetical protein